jgi:hypothetical protein
MRTTAYVIYVSLLTAYYCHYWYTTTALLLFIFSLRFHILHFCFQLTSGEVVSSPNFGLPFTFNF